MTLQYASYGRLSITRNPQHNWLDLLSAGDWYLEGWDNEKELFVWSHSDLPDRQFASKNAKIVAKTLICPNNPVPYTEEIA